jgi:hypothetical protein
MVDAMVNSVEDYLIDGLSFKLNPGASYVTDRRSVSYWTAGSNEYASGTGSKVIRINLTGDGWLDPSTVRVIYTLQNNDGTTAKMLRPLSGPWSFFRRLRCLVGGAIVDDIDYYNRIHEMVHILTAKENRSNDQIEGFGPRWDDDDVYNGWTADGTSRIPGNSARTVSFKPLAGLLNQPKYIPLSYCPITFELEVVTNAEDPIISTGGAEFNTTTNTSTSWTIKDVRIACDVVTLDSALQNSYAEHVLSGKALPINYSTYISQFQTITSSDFAVNISRSASRLKSVFITFDDVHTTTSAQNGAHKIMNTFTHPMRGTGYVNGDYDYSKELQWQIQIGSKMFPEYPVRSLAETFYQLKKSLGIHGSAFHNVSVNRKQYHNDHFIIGIDTEKILEAGFTGLNTRAGDLMVVRGKYANSNSSSTWANSVYVVMHTDQILEIRDTGSQVFD